MRFLIIEAEEKMGDRFIAVLDNAGETAHQIITAEDNVIACIRLVQHQPDLIFLPATTSGLELQNGLRLLQPEARFVFMVADEKLPLPDQYLNGGDGMLALPRIEDELIPLLNQLATNQAQDGVVVAAGTHAGIFPEPALSRLMAQMAARDVVHTVILSHEADILSYAGDLTPQQTAVAALYVYESWGGGRHTAQVQFAQISTSLGTLLLYSRPVADDCLLTVLAYPQTLVSYLRRLANELAIDVARLGGFKDPVEMELSPAAMTPQSSHVLA